MCSYPYLAGNLNTVIFASMQLSNIENQSTFFDKNFLTSLGWCNVTREQMHHAVRGRLKKKKKARIQGSGVFLSLAVCGFLAACCGAL